MQLKLCWIWLQQVWVWPLWQWLYAEKKNPDSQTFSQVVSRGEGSIHQVHQHVQALYKRLCGDFDTIQWRGQQNRWVQPRTESTLSQRQQLWLVRVNAILCCTRHQHNMTKADIEFAHDGRGFPTWHRLYMLAWGKKPCRKLVTMKNLALPYWDWTGSKTQCDPAICSEELLGVTNQADGTVKGKYFNNWYVICSNEQFLLPDEDVWPNEQETWFNLEQINEKKN